MNTQQKCKICRKNKPLENYEVCEECLQKSIHLAIQLQDFPEYHALYRQSQLFVIIKPCSKRCDKNFPIMGKYICRSKDPMEAVRKFYESSYGETSEEVE